MERRHDDPQLREGHVLWSLNTMTVLLLLLTVACDSRPGDTAGGVFDRFFDDDSGEEPAHPCDDGGEPSLELAEPGGEFGAMVDGVDLLYGIPPQGGAPFAPIQVRLRNLPTGAEGYTTTITATEPGAAEPIGTATYIHRLVCANVGPHEGTYVGPELHLRFHDLDLDELAGRVVTVEVVTQSDTDLSVSSGFTATLVQMEQ